MLQIGTNENIFLEKVVLDDKNALELTFQETTVKAKPKSNFANIAGDEVVEGNTGMSIRLFSPLPPKKEDMTEEKKVDLVVGDINKTKGILIHILLGYKTSADLKGIWNACYDGLPITEDNHDQQILVKEILEGVHKNIARIFLQHIKPFLNNKELAFRLLLVRQSKEKHYATFRGRFISDNPFWESMSIPKEASKLWVPMDPKDLTKGYRPNFTKYELDNGLDTGIPVQKSDAADPKTAASSATAGPGGAPLSAANVFGG